MAIEGYGYRAYAKPGNADACFQIIKALLSRESSDPDYRPHGEAPLIEAVKRGQDDVVSLLLQSGADPWVKVGGHLSALEEAEFGMKINQQKDGQRSYAKTLELIRNALQDPHQKERSFMRAVRFGDIDGVSRLIKEGVEMNGGSFGTWTPLICATQHAITSGLPHYAEVVRIIASTKGVDKAIKHDGKAAFEMAKSAGRSDLMEALR